MCVCVCVCVCVVTYLLAGVLSDLQQVHLETFLHLPRLLLGRRLLGTQPGDLDGGGDGRDMELVDSLGIAQCHFLVYDLKPILQS